MKFGQKINFFPLNSKHYNTCSSLQIHLNSIAIHKVDAQILLLIYKALLIKIFKPVFYMAKFCK